MLVLLGPQRARPTVRAAVDQLGIKGPLALITAGWQEREPDDEELREDLGRESFNLSLYQRAERLSEAEPELAKRLRARQDKLRRLQEHYRHRLDHYITALLETEHWHDADLIEPERAQALDAVRALDRHQLQRVRELRAGFDEELPGAIRERLQQERAAVAAEIARAEAVIIAGGHVAGMLNRMRLFDVGPALSRVPVIAWSAGAMVVGERIVLFHDTPPQGQGHAEVLDAGLGLGTGLLPLPHGRTRLRLQDRSRVARFAQRFPELCPVLLEAGARVDRREDAWHAVDTAPWAGAERLFADGSVGPFTEASA